MPIALYGPFYACWQGACRIHDWETVSAKKVRRECVSPSDIGDIFHVNSIDTTSQRKDYQSQTSWIVVILFVLDDLRRRKHCGESASVFGSVSLFCLCLSSVSNVGQMSVNNKGKAHVNCPNCRQVKSPMLGCNVCSKDITNHITRLAPNTLNWKRNAIFSSMATDERGSAVWT